MTWASAVLAVAPITFFLLSFQAMGDFESDAFLYYSYAAGSFMLPALVAFTVYLFKSSAVPRDKRLLWLAVLGLGHVLAFPVFWYIYVFKRQPEGTEQL